MKPTPKNSSFLFWSIVVLIITVVVTVTAGTYVQYKMAIAEPETIDSLSMAYQMASSAKSVWCLVLNFF